MSTDPMIFKMLQEVLVIVRELKEENSRIEEEKEENDEDVRARLIEIRDLLVKVRVKQNL